MTQAHTPKYIVSGRWDGHGNDFYLVSQRDDKTVNEIAETARKIGNALNAHDDLVNAVQKLIQIEDEFKTTDGLISQKCLDALNAGYAALAAAQVQS